MKQLASTLLLWLVATMLHAQSTACYDTKSPFYDGGPALIIADQPFLVDYDLTSEIEQWDEGKRSYRKLLYFFRPEYFEDTLQINGESIPFSGGSKTNTGPYMFYSVKRQNTLSGYGYDMRYNPKWTRAGGPFHWPNGDFVYRTSMLNLPDEIYLNVKDSILNVRDSVSAEMLFFKDFWHTAYTNGSNAYSRKATINDDGQVKVCDKLLYCFDESDKINIDTLSFNEGSCLNTGNFYTSIAWGAQHKDEDARSLYSFHEGYWDDGSAIYRNYYNIHGWNPDKAPQREPESNMANYKVLTHSRAFLCNPGRDLMFNVRVDSMHLQYGILTCTTRTIKRKGYIYYIPRYKVAADSVVSLYQPGAAARARVGTRSMIIVYVDGVGIGYSAAIDNYSPYYESCSERKTYVPIESWGSVTYYPASVIEYLRNDADRNLYDRSYTEPNIYKDTHTFYFDWRGLLPAVRLSADCDQIREILSNEINFLGDEISHKDIVEAEIPFLGVTDNDLWATDPLTGNPEEVNMAIHNALLTDKKSFAKYPYYENRKKPVGISETQTTASPSSSGTISPSKGIFSLDGRRLTEEPTKGVFIKDGRKVVR